MSTDQRQLDQMQRWMHAVITHPGGAAMGIESDAAQEQIPLASEQLELVIRRSRNLTSVERLQVYAGAYYARLIECLRVEFPSLVHVLGMETFDRFAFAYLQRYPSSSYTLANLGGRFPQYLAETRPSEEALSGELPGWPQFLIDLAVVERTYSEVFDGPGVEGERCLQAEDLLQISPERWPDARLIVVPCLRLLTLQYPVHEYISAVRHNKEPAIPGAAPTYLVVSRCDYIVRRRSVAPVEFEVLKALADGKSVGTSLERAAELSQTEFEVLAASVRQWFCQWSLAAYLQAVELAE